MTAFRVDRNIINNFVDSDVCSFLIFDGAAPRIENGLLMPETPLEKFTDRVFYSREFNKTEVIIIDLRGVIFKERRALIDWFDSAQIIDYGFARSIKNLDFFSALISEFVNRAGFTFDFVYEPELACSALECSYWPEFVDVEGAKEGILIIDEIFLDYFFLYFKELIVVGTENSLGYSEDCKDNKLDKSRVIAGWKNIKLSEKKQEAQIEGTELKAQDTRF